MSLPALADAQALKVWLGLSTIDLDRADAVLEAASAIVRDVAGDDYTDEVPAKVAAITVQVAARMWENPGGLESETAGQWTGRYSREWITQAEEQTLAKTKPTSGLWTLSTTRGEFEVDGYVSVAGQDKPVRDGLEVLDRGPR